MTSDLTTSPVDRQNMDMTEHQTVEYKQIWKDEYLKWLVALLMLLVVCW